ncbi:hypothetical protein B0H14DRAFT_3512341 [Mycena olivaceomarginata]|nr:hypothetical protein B0H14DRAFT_3512341 [Mycena olivaceomarginata]
MATIKTTTPALPDYITYRFANRLVYVRPAQTYEVPDTGWIQRDHSSVEGFAALTRLRVRCPPVRIA